MSISHYKRLNREDKLKIIEAYKNQVRRYTSQALDEPTVNIVAKDLKMTVHRLSTVLDEFKIPYLKSQRYGNSCNHSAIESPVI